MAFNTTIKGIFTHYKKGIYTPLRASTLLAINMGYLRALNYFILLKVTIK